jgi:hypothetical protein
MNERIRLLADEADNYAEQTVHYYMGQFDGLTWEGKIKQVRDTKFAELIVKECIECIQLTTARDPQYTVQYRQSVGHIHRIREHFGVE